jgi:hypothetical protein
MSCNTELSVGMYYTYENIFNVQLSMNYPYCDVVVGLVWSHDPKSYAGGSICYW